MTNNFKDITKVYQDGVSTVSAEDLNNIINSGKTLENMVEASCMKYQILSSIEDYNSINSPENGTMYLVITDNKITNAFIGSSQIAISNEEGDNNIPIERIVLYHPNLKDNSLTIERDDDTTFEADIYPTDTTERALRWLTDNIRVANVDETGKLFPVGRGTCTIKAVSKKRGDIVSEVSITVVVVIKTFELTSEHERLVHNLTTATTPVYTPTDSDLNISYKSSDESIATVDENGVITPLASEGNVTITATDSITNKTASISLDLCPFDAETNFKEDTHYNGDTLVVNNTLLTIVPKIRGNASDLELIEIAEWSGGNETVDTELVVKQVQDTGFKAIPTDGSGIQCKLFPELGNKKLTFKYKNPDGEIVVIDKDVILEEPDRVTHTFEFNIECSAEDAETANLTIPDLKYDKKFAHSFRCDDGHPTVMRHLMPYCNGEWMFRELGEEARDGKGFSYVEMTSKETLWKAPRKLGYTDGCGKVIPFVFDSCCWLYRDGGRYIWDGDQAGIYITEDEIRRASDFGAHFMMHDCEPNNETDEYPQFYRYWVNTFYGQDSEGDTHVIKTTITKDGPDQEADRSDEIKDRTYAIQRDQKIIEETFGYCPLSLPIPGGNTAYPQPAYNNIRLLAYACNSESAKRWWDTLELSTSGYLDDDNNFVAQEDTRTHAERSLHETSLYSHAFKLGTADDISQISFKDLRNGMAIDYMFSDNAFPISAWSQQYQGAKLGIKTLMQSITHGNGNSLESRQKFDLVCDAAGYTGDDSIWFGSLDEFLEYMYYKRASNISKEITETGCKFTITCTLPDYLPYKTYSAIIEGVTGDINVSYPESFTSFDINKDTGLINFGISKNTPERANRYIQKYLSDPSDERLDQAWFFVERLGELGKPYESLIPKLSRVPNIEVSNYSFNEDDNEVSVTIKNLNKSFGEMESLSYSANSDLSENKSIEIGTENHKYLDLTDETSMQYDFTFSPRNIYGEDQITYLQANNFYGGSNIVTVTTSLPRVNGVNDPYLSAKVDTLFDTEGGAWINIDAKFITQLKVTVDSVDVVPWSYSWDKRVFLPMSIDTHSVTVDVKNNLGETLHYEESVNYIGAMKKYVLASSGTVNAQPTEIEGVGMINPMSNSTKPFDVMSIDNQSKLGDNVRGYYLGDLLKSIKTGFGYSEEGVVCHPAYGHPSFGTAEEGPYPVTLLGSGTSERRILWGGGVVGEALTNVTPGNYIVRVLVEHWNNESAGNCIILINDQSKTVTPDQLELYWQNTKNFVEFEDVVVGEDGYFYYGLTSDGPLPDNPSNGASNIPYIALIEIYKKND